VNQLCNPKTAAVLFGSVDFYEKRGDWWLHLFLLMPDHLHILASFAPHVALRGMVKAWKRFTARSAGIEWQRDWFDHRVQREESYREKADYILQNPVRAGLATNFEDWPYMRIAR
jgi:REP element-mobilizing transposase RayT